MKTGLIGKKLGHSISPLLHSHLGEYEYKLYELEENELEGFFRHCPLDAFNVTIPYKKAVIPYLRAVSPTAALAGAVNTVIRRPDGLYGYNTDVEGFGFALDRTGFDPAGKKVLIAGSGGASAAAAVLLKRRAAKETVILSRTGEDHYGNLYRHADAKLIINATPVGMFPENGASPLPLSPFPELCAAADMIYNPAMTEFLFDAKERGLPFVNGLPMLTAQAVFSAELFLGAPLQTDIGALTETIAAKRRNTVIIGMPGAGKTTYGKKLAEKTNRPFLDTDEMIREKTSRTPAEIILSQGEDAFRELETQVIREAGKHCGTVIATGGGAVERQRNYRPLKQNGDIVYLRRPLSALAVGDRPVTQAVGLAALYEKRAPLYEAWADSVTDGCP